MATHTHLSGWQVAAVKGAEQEQNGDFTDTWTLVFQEHATGNRVLFAMRRAARDELVRQLTGGVVLAGGEFPPPPPPRPKVDKPPGTEFRGI